MARPFVRFVSLWLLACAAVTNACAADRSEAASERPGSAGPERRFSYVGVDGTPFDTRTTLGRATVVLFLTTYDLPSQLAARQLDEVVHSHRPRINAGAVVLEPPRNSPLVEAFASALRLGFPVAVADASTMSGYGPFGDIAGVPTTIVLDSDGREVWRSAGYAPPERLEEVLSRVTR